MKFFYISTLSNVYVRCEVQSREGEHVFAVSSDSVLDPLGTAIEQAVEGRAGVLGSTVLANAWAEGLASASMVCVPYFDRTSPHFLDEEVLPSFGARIRALVNTMNDTATPGGTQ